MLELSHAACKIVVVCVIYFTKLKLALATNICVISVTYAHVVTA